MDAKQRALLVASVAGLVAAAGVSSVASAMEAESSGAKVACYGINKCKGAGSCGGAGHSCAGMNACKGQGYLEIEKDTCLKIESGRLTEQPEAS